MVLNTLRSSLLFLPCLCFYSLLAPAQERVYHQARLQSELQAEQKAGEEVDPVQVGQGREEVDPGQAGQGREEVDPVHGA